MRRFGSACMMGVSALLVLTGCSAFFPSQPAGAPDGSSASLSGVVPSQFRDATLTVSTGNNNPPLYFETKNGAPAGLTREIADSAADLLGLKLDIQPSGFDTVIPELQSGTIDVAIYGMDVTAERIERIDMVSYFAGGHRVMTYENHLTLDDSVTSLCGLTLGGIAGSSWVRTVSEMSTSQCAAETPITVKEYKDQAGANTAAIEHKIDGVVIASIAGNYATANDSDWSLTGPALQVVPVGMAFTKGSGLGEAFEIALNELIANGTYDQIFQKYDVAEQELDRATLNPQ